MDSCQCENGGSNALRRRPTNPTPSARCALVICPGFVGYVRCGLVLGATPRSRGLERSPMRNGELGATPVVPERISRELAGRFRRFARRRRECQSSAPRQGEISKFRAGPRMLCFFNQNAPREISEFRATPAWVYLGLV